MKTPALRCGADLVISSSFAGSPWNSAPDASSDLWSRKPSCWRPAGMGGPLNPQGHFMFLVPMERCGSSEWTERASCVSVRFVAATQRSSTRR
ncbi:MAG: hypothetical protein ACI841_002644 [Planctomycetota bacterium]|jgi:hypothetical protein